MTLCATFSDAEAQALFDEGNQHYARGETAAALERWERLTREGVRASSLEHNLGTAWLATGDLGRAALHLHRALRLDHHPDTAAQLARLAQQQQDEVLAGGGETPFLERLTSRTSPAPWAWSLVTGLWLLWAAAALALRPGRRLRQLVGVGAVLLCLGGGAGLGLHVTGETLSGAQAVVLPVSLPVRQGPTPDARVLFEVHAGLLLRRTGLQGPFAQVRLPNGLTGWVDSAGVEAL